MFVYISDVYSPDVCLQVGHFRLVDLFVKDFYLLLKIKQKY